MRHTYRVSGMKCDGCAKTVSDKLSSVIGVDEVNVDLTKNQVVVSGKTFKWLLKRSLKDTKYSLEEEIN
ncbi:heavy-metal-associated domain-containing protein [Streptococcus agalactiae]|uniref:heavy-metal-associated domain-containing protein n=1 Tax=Streptococcus agalactiae TaxID=1311 RepID=UPI000312DA3E|nr:heavy-metal-associated domain-containing protein [Streptococcus agalactiae]MBR3055389.1 heavy-metal-associated domain-containing protein [Streptococcus sp.]AKI56864.1 Carbonate dehydratase [Streptococcus agalactiae]ASI65443.1 carbonate dehydratase [Streptococcus agalactiae]EPW74147.1 carbonate dehydratase [Streptococcus agalactiae BSU451]EPW91948.1 carbonate dehydratase [Streptococcus agalactiae MRI Z1-023]